jgi:hypothetical protein
LQHFTEADEDMLSSFCEQVATIVKRKNLQSMYNNALVGSGAEGENELSALLTQYTGQHRPAEEKTTSASTSIGMSGTGVDDARSNSVVQSLAPGMALVEDGQDSLVESELFEWRFSALDHDPDTLMKYAHTMFHELDLMTHFKISDSRLLEFTKEVVSRYRTDVPYHNFHHAFTVLHAVFLTLTKTAAIDCITIEDALALFVAAFCHDMGHRGMNNAFHAQCIHNDVLIPDLAIT